MIEALGDNFQKSLLWTFQHSKSASTGPGRNDSGHKGRDKSNLGQCAERRTGNEPGSKRPLGHCCIPSAVAREALASTPQPPCVDEGVGDGHDGAVHAVLLGQLDHAVGVEAGAMGGNTIEG